MAQRSPHHQRYQKDAKVGSTRKSAASAKPKRSAGERGSSSSSKSDSGEKKGGFLGMFSQSWTPEIGMWRRRSMFLLMAALIIAVLGFIPQVQEILGQYPFLAWVGIGLYLVLLGGAIYIDWGIVRKLRNEELARQKEEKGGKGGKKS
jgi:hypothetical protein